MMSATNWCLRLGAAVAFFLCVGGRTGMAASRAEDQVDPRGEILSLSCSSCHGTDGRSVGIIPSFYGKSPEYLEMALLDFRSGKRYSTVMQRHAKGYTDEQIHLIAEYYGNIWQQKDQQAR